MIPYKNGILTLHYIIWLTAARILVQMLPVQSDKNVYWILISNQIVLVHHIPLTLMIRYAAMIRSHIIIRASFLEPFVFKMEHQEIVLICISENVKVSIFYISPLILSDQIYLNSGTIPFRFFFKFYWLMYNALSAFEITGTIYFFNSGTHFSNIAGNIYFFKVSNRNTKKGVKYVRSSQ